MANALIAVGARRCDFALISLSCNFSAAAIWWKGKSLTLQFGVIIPEKFMYLEAFILVSDFSADNAGDPQGFWGLVFCEVGATQLLLLAPSL